MIDFTIATTPYVLSVGLIATAVALKVVLGVADKRSAPDRGRFERRWVWPLYALLGVEVIVFLFA